MEILKFPYWLWIHTDAFPLIGYEIKSYLPWETDYWTGIIIFLVQNFIRTKIGIFFIKVFLFNQLLLNLDQWFNHTTQTYSINFRIFDSTENICQWKILFLRISQSFFWLYLRQAIYKSLHTQSFQKLYNLIFIIISTLQVHDSFSNITCYKCNQFQL